MSIFRKLISQVSKKQSDEEDLSDKGVAAWASGRPEEAVLLFDQVLGLNPRRVDAWSNKGSSLMLLQRPQEALACFDRAIELDAKAGAAWSMKAAALEGLGASRSRNERMVGLASDRSTAGTRRALHSNES